jgi:hypothetical protein
MALKALQEDPNHTLDEGCLISTALQQDEELERSFSNRNQITTALATRISRQNKLHLREINGEDKPTGENLSQTQVNTRRQIFRTFLEPWSDPT